MSGNRRQSRPSATTPVDSIPNTRTMGNERLRVFIRNMETPNSFREAFGEHLGIPSVRTRLHPPQPGVLLQRVGNVAQRRRDMVPVGTRYATPTFFYLRLRELTCFFGQLLAGWPPPQGMEGPTA